MSGASDFARWCKQRRRVLGMTQGELAAAICYSVASVRKVEEGIRLPSLQMAQLLAHHLEVPESAHPAFIKAARVGQAIEPFPEVMTPADVPNNLPASSLTRLIDRDEIVAHVRQLLVDGNVRLLTLTGPPGIGKTSIALETARGVCGPDGGFDDGVFFVDLSPVTEARFLAGTIAGELGLGETGEGPIFDRLVEHLRAKSMLLVLDNFEQIIEGAGQVSSLLISCPRVKVLVTSREAMNVRGERLLPVPPLEVPPLDVQNPDGGGVVHLQPPEVEDIRKYAAVKLLVERAAAVDPSFLLTRENAAYAAQVCARLEGLPLAIELVAARTRLIPMQDLVALLDRKLPLLEGGPRDVPPRQRTLRAAIEWSYNLLDREEQVLFTRLGTFAGGCSYPAAEAVCNATGDLRIDVLGGLESLLKKSLLRRELRGGEWRFVMLETIREYAHDELEVRGEASTLRRLHAEYFLTMAEATEPELAGMQQKAWLDRLEREHDNLRAALRWAIDSGSLLMAARLSGGLGRFWSTHGHLNEGRQWLDTVLDHIACTDQTLPPSVVARVLSEAGYLAAIQADYKRGIALYEQALRMVRRADDKQENALILFNLSRLKNEIGCSDDAREYGLQSLELYKALNNIQGMANVLNMLGTVDFYTGHTQQGVEWYEQSLTLYRETGDNRGAANVLNNLGEIARMRGDYSRAAALYRESLEPCKQLGDRVGTAITLNNLGFMALNLGNHAEAQDLFAESLSLCRGLGSPRTTALALYGMAGTLGKCGRREDAARLFGAADALSRKIKTSYAPADRADVERHMQTTRGAMPEASWQSAWREGYAMAADLAIALALSANAIAPSI